MANSCGRSLKACVTEVTKLTQDGSPAIGPKNGYRTGDMVTLTMGSEFSDDDDFEMRGASGDICLRYFALGPFKRLSLNLELCSADPELHALLIGETPLTAGNAVGMRWPKIGQAAGCGNTGYFGVSIQVWTLHVRANGELDPNFPYIRWVIPRTFWRPDERVFENAPMAHKFTGNGEENGEWLDGPNNDWPVGSDRAAQWLPVATAPVAQCGYIPVASS